MVSEAVVIETVKRMLSSGIDEAIIVSTLKDIGLSEDEARAFIARASEKEQLAQPSPSQSIFKQQSSQPSEINEMELMKAQLDAQAQAIDLHSTTTQNILNTHEEKIEEVGKKVEEIKQVVQKIPENVPITDPTLGKKLVDINAKLDDVSAMLKANKEIMQSILEVNRKILSELEAKK